MVTLTEENLGKRQQELNLKVNESINKNINFEEVKAQAKDTDIDMLYIIDLASKYKNVKYIIEVLKAGDSLYISRALKCSWLYNNDFSDIINTDYLHHNIFPFMSLKMKKKFLTTISTYLRNERAASFYTYCINIKLYNIALKFLIFTSEFFKQEVIKGHSLHKIVEQDEDYILFLIANSFILANAYMERLNEYQRPGELYKLRYLFSVSDTEYLDLLEKYQEVDKINSKFGLRMSKRILTKHRNRCLHYPLLYMNILNKTIVTKYLTIDEASNIVLILLPSKVEKFWSERICTAYDFILNIIPEAERFQWLKNVFISKYPSQEFEMTKEFFTSESYTFMTREERESWALRHIESKKEIQGDGCDYLWYKFVKFDVAFPEVKEYITKTKDFNNTSKKLNVLIELTTNERELELLLNYFYNRHMNEAKSIKESFVTHILRTHNISEFDHDCWILFNKILYSLNVYNVHGRKCNLITFAALIYHIIHKIDVPVAVQKYITSISYWNIVITDRLYSNLSEEHQNAVYKYLLKFYLDKMAEDEADINNDNSKYIKYKYAESVVHLLEAHKKSMDDCPDIIKNYIESNLKQFRSYELIKDMNKYAERDILRLLKQDARNVIHKISYFRRMIKHDYCFKMNCFLKKIKIYFPDSIARHYLSFFTDIISEKDLSMNSIYIAVYGIFQLANEQFKAAFMAKYAPLDPKTDYNKIDTHTLYIQEGICRYACFSRPPVLLSNILMYIVGDYVQHCSPIFNTYLTNLPIPLCTKFAELLIESPLQEVQKYGILLAFQNINTENQKTLIRKTWHKTTDVSLRLTIYQKLYNKIVDSGKTLQLELFEVLKSFTSDLRDDELNKLNELLYSRNLPENLLREYIPVSWQIVSRLIDNSINVKSKTAVILNMGRNLHLLDAMFVKPIVEEIITDQVVKEGITNYYEIADLEYLYDCKWELVTAYMIYFVNDKNLLLKNIEHAKLIIRKCVEMWNTVQNEIFAWRRFWWNFIEVLVEWQRNNGSYKDAIPIYEAVLLCLQESLPLHVTYLKCWSLRMTIISRKFIEEGKLKFDKETEKHKKVDIIKQTVISFAHAAGELIEQSVEDKVYFDTYVSAIKDIVYNNVHGIKYGINFNYEVSVDYDDVYIAAVAGLLQINLPETYILAVYVMPIVSSEYSDKEYESNMNKIKEYDNDQVQFCFYQKFVNTDLQEEMDD